MACSRQQKMERFDLAPARKMRPARMFRMPMEKRKKAETSVKSSMWCERMEAPRLGRG